MRRPARVLAPALAVALAATHPSPAAAQEDDRGFLTRLIEENLSGAGRAVRIEGFEGALSSTARIREMTIADEGGVWLSMRGVEMTWNRAALLRGRLEVNRLVAAEIDVPRAPQAGGDAALPSPEATPFALPDLPVSVEIGQISAGRVTLGAPLLGEALAITLDGGARLAGGEGTVRLEASRIDGRAGRVVLAGGYANATRVLGLNLEASEAAGGIAATLIGVPGAPALDLSIAGEGPIDAYTAQIRLASDGAERLAGSISLRSDGAASGFAVDIAGDLAPLFLPDYRAFFGDRIALVAAGQRAPTGALRLDTLRLETAQVSISGRARIAPDGLPESLAFDLAIASGTGGPVLLPIPGDPVRVGGARLSLAFDPAAADEGWRVAGTLDALDAPQVAIRLLDLNGSGRIARQPGGAQAIGGTLRYRAEGLALADPGLAAAVGERVGGLVRFNWLAGGALRITDLTLAGDGYSADAAMALSTAGRPSVEGRIAAELGDFARLSILARQPLGGAGRIAVNGRVVPLDGVFDARATIVADDLRSGIAEIDGLLAGRATVALDAARDETGTTVRTLTLRAGTLGVDAAGTIRTQGTEFTARARFDDLGVLGPQYRGAMAADLTVAQANGADRLTLRGTARDLAFGIAELDSFLRGATQVSADLTHRSGAITLDALRIEGPSIDARAAGTVTPGDPLRADLTATVALPDLARLGPPYGGALTAEARVTAAAGREGVTLTATATDLRTGIPEADGMLRGPVRLDAAAVREGGVITLERLRLDGRALAASVTGTLSDALTALNADLTLPDLSAAGARFGGSLAGRAALRIADGVEAVTLDARTANLRVGQAEADRLLAGPATLALAARRTDGVIRLDRLRLDGRQVMVEATGQNGGERTTADVSARLSDLALLVPGVPGAVTLTGRVGADPAGYDLDLALRGPGGIDATAAGRIAADASRATLRAQGRAEAALANAFLGPVSLRGPVAFDLAVNGAPTLAAVSGRVTLTGGRVTLADPPLSLADVNTTVTLGGGRAQIDATARNEPGGTLAIRGPVALSAPYAGDLAVTLQGVVLRDPNLYQTSLTGTVRANGPLAGGARISGAIALGPTELRIPSSGLGGASTIPDLRHLSEPPRVRTTRARAGLLETAGAAGRQGTARPYPLDLRFDAPARVFIRGRGLDAELGGALVIQGTSSAPVPIGGFELIRGRLDLLGKRFNLNGGKLFIEGDFIPRLDLAATTQTDDITATIAVVGRADEPTIRFLSQPELPEEEVVARLLFGRGLETLSAFQAAQLAVAVATLTGRGGAGIVDRLRRSFGLDDLDVTTGTDGAAAFRAGRYLTENLYADVVFGSAGKTEVTLNLDLTPSITVRGRAATDGTTGIGVYFERDY